MRSSACKSWMRRMGMTLAAFVLTVTLALAQTKTVTGTVVDNFGDPVIGANVIVKGTSLGATTDIDGNFSIAGVADNADLVISFIGYTTQTVNVAGQTAVNITLKEDASDLEEVVVVGYGVQKKKDLTGSVASVKAGDIANVAAPNAMQAMQAKVPGVDLQQSSGEAGAGVSITMRGNRSIQASNSPLILVDGVEYGSTLDVPASEIESMDILKDAASTAIYGTKGANGVIIITTKRGKSGKTVVGLNSYVSFNSPTGVVKPMQGNKELQRMIDAKDYQTAAANDWDFSKGGATAADVLGSMAISDGTLLTDIVKEGSYTDWLDLILKNYSVSQNYELNVSGGSEKTNFNIAASVMNDNGLMEGESFNRYTGRANIDHKINKVFKTGASLSYTYKSNDKRNSGMYNQALKMTTITHAYSNDGTINETPSQFYLAHSNPLLDYVDGNYQRNIETTRFLGSAYLQADVIKGLVLKTLFSVDRKDERDGLYQDYQSTSRYQSPANTYISNARSANTKYNWQNTANYNLTLDKNNINLLLGHEVTQSVTETSKIYGTAGAEHYYKSSFYDVSKIGAPTSETTYLKTSLVSFFGRVNYSFDSKYLLQASLRADGSSVLADGHKWGYFPSVSAGWRIIDEKWMQGLNEAIKMDNLKIRLSWGLSGNAAVDAYQTLATVSSIVPNSTDKAPMSMSNPELTWEKTSAFDIGLDFGFLGNRINGSIDYYKSNTYDLLYYKQAPASSVFTSVLSNVGETEGSGIEVALNALAVKTSDFSWDINLSYTSSNDKVKKLVDGLDEFIDGYKILKVGEPVSAFYTYEVDGNWNVGEFKAYKDAYKSRTGKDFVAPSDSYGNPGTPKAIDRNDDGQITEADKKVFTRSPKAIIGMTNTFAYKDFSLSVQAMARLGGYMYYSGYTQFTYDGSNWVDADYWTPANPGAIMPTPGTTQSAVSNYVDAICIQKADYFKIKDITLSYSMPKNILAKAHLSNAKIYCSLKNFITVSKIDNYDSERNGSISFPLSKQVVIGLNLQF